MEPIELPTIGKAIQPGTFRIINAQSRRALGIAPGEAGNGTQVKQFDLTDSLDQVWQLEAVHPGECDRTPFHPNIFRVRHVRTGLYLDADHAHRATNGWPVLLWDRGAVPKSIITPFPNDQQLWHINRLDPAKYQVANIIDLAVAVQCRNLDAPTQTIEQNGAAVQLWSPANVENQKWQFIPAVAPAPAPTVAKSSPIAAVYSSARAHSDAFHVGANGGLRYVYEEGGIWRFDTTHLRDGAPLSGPVSAVFEPSRNHSAVVARGKDGRLRYFYVQGSAWKVDASTLGVAAGDVSAVFSPARNHTEVFFADDARKLHYAYVDGGAWRHHRHDVGEVGGRISAVYSPARRHSEVFWVRADGRLVYSFVDGGAWHHDSNSLAVAGRITGAVSAVFSTARNASEVFAAGEDGKVHYLYVDGGAWRHDAKSLGKTRGQLSAVFSPHRNHSELVFIRDDGRPVYAYVDRGAWKLDDDTFAVAGPVHDVALVYSPARKHSEAFLTGADRFLHFLYVHDRGDRGYPAWHYSKL